MSETSEIITINSSPPTSPNVDQPNNQNVSDLCLDIYEKDNFPFSPENLKTAEVAWYHTLSESDEEQHIINLGVQVRKDTNGEKLLEAKKTKHSQKSKSKESKLEKEKQKEIKTKEKEEKAKEKAQRAAFLEKIRQTKPGECMKYVTVTLDESISSTELGEKTLELFKDVQFEYKLAIQRDPFSVTWSREEPGRNVFEEKHILFVWSFDKLVTSMKYCTLIDTFKEYINKYVGYRIYLSFYGLPENFKKFKRSNGMRKNTADNEEKVPTKRKRISEIHREQFEMSLAELEVFLKVSTRSLKNHHELSLLVQQITKAIAETPYRKEIEKRDLEKSWYTRGDSRDCVKVDKEFNGLNRLWIQHLCQFNNSTLDTAKSIANIYPSPLALYQAYEKIDAQKEKELLLKNIEVKRGGNSNSTRRVGPELSRKVSLLFGQKNGDIFLSQE